MPTCIEGHKSLATDYCDVCGASMEEVVLEGDSTVEAAACPSCAMPVVGRFCESCGHDMALPAPAPAPVAEVVPGLAAWTAVIAADREFYARVIAREGPDTVDFPLYFPERRVVLSGTALIGRANPRKGVDPEIDLGIDPSDVGVSTQHAVIRVEESGVTITDLGSTNGTSLNGSEALLPKGVPTPLVDGDRVHVGAWTTIRIVRG